VPIVAAIIVLACIVWLIITFNAFIRGRHLMREAWSGIDVQLRRRHNLIPNLVETVKGYAAHERKLFEEVTRLRRMSAGTEAVREKGEAENALSQVLASLLVVAEAYPDLRASGNFLNLQQSLSEIEDQIQLARRYYNGTVRNYNIRVESFPSILVAKLFGFKRADYFEIELATQRKVPRVGLEG